MPQAILMRQENLILISTKTELPIADVQAMYENLSEFTHVTGDRPYMVIDINGADGRWVPYSEMSGIAFRQHFRFVYGENPNKFMPVVPI